MSDPLPHRSTAHYAIYIALISTFGTIVVAVISQWKNIFPPESIVEPVPKSAVIERAYSASPGSAPPVSEEANTLASAKQSEALQIPSQVTTVSTDSRSASVAGATQAPAFSGGILSIAVREDSWVEVRPRGGRALVSALLRAGTTHTVHITGPVSLVVGDPSNVTVTLDKRELQLPLVEGKTISRINVE